MQSHRNFRPRAFPKKIGKGVEIKGIALTTRLIKTANQKKKKKENFARNQSELKVNTRDGPKARENADGQIGIGLNFKCIFTLTGIRSSSAIKYACPLPAPATP